MRKKKRKKERRPLLSDMIAGNEVLDSRLNRRHKKGRWWGGDRYGWRGHGHTSEGKLDKVWKEGVGVCLLVPLLCLPLAAMISLLGPPSGPHKPILSLHMGLSASNEDPMGRWPRARLHHFACARSKGRKACNPNKQISWKKKHFILVNDIIKTNQANLR